MGEVKQRRKVHLMIEYTLHRRGAVTASMLLIVLLATALRLHELDTDSLWGDEIFEVRNVEKDLASILGITPLAIRLATAHIFMLIGTQDFLFRFSYAVIGVLGVVLMYQVGRALFNDTTGVIGAFLLAILPFHIQYSQEARSYSWTILLVLTSLYCLCLALRDNQARHWIGFAVATAFSLSNHITTASVLAGEMAYGTLALLLNRFSRPAENRRTQREIHSEATLVESRLGTWLRRLHASREVMLVISALAGIVVFLLASGSWFSYLGQIGIGAAGSGTATSGPVMRISGTFIRRLLGAFGAGEGLALPLFTASFMMGLVSCAIARQWRQLLLAPLWMLPPFLLLPRTTSTVALYPRHLIFILPIYLLFIARGVTGIRDLVTRFAGRSASARRLAGATALLLLVMMTGWLSIEPVQAYYRGQKEDWRGVAQRISNDAKPGDLVVQLVGWPTDAVPYYLESLPGGSDIKLETLENASESDFPATVWWVMTIGQPGTRPSSLPAPEELVGSEFEIYSFPSLPFKSPAILRRETPIADHVDFLQAATKLALVQLQSDSWSYFEGHLKRLNWLTDLPETSFRPPECPPEFSDPNRYLQTARDQYRSEQRQEALDSTLKAMAMYEMLYPDHGRPHDSILQALYDLGDSARESGHQACSVLFYSRAAEARLLDVELEPASIDAWQHLAETLVKAERHEQAVALAPEELRPRRYLADAYFLDGRMTEAAQVFRQLVEATPEDIDARLGLALAYAALNRNSEAIRELRTLMEIDPDHWLVPEAESKLHSLEQ